MRWPSMAVGSKGGPPPGDVFAKTCVGEQHVNVGVAVDYAHPARPGHARPGKP